MSQWMTSAPPSSVVTKVPISMQPQIATTTERAARLESHIMHGKNTAAIKIVIRNKRGPCELQDIASLHVSNGVKAKHLTNRLAESGCIEELDDSEDEDEHADGDNPPAAVSSDDSSTYKWDVYGDSITIERTLNRNGRNIVKVKGATDKNVMKHPILEKNPAKEVAAICDHFVSWSPTRLLFLPRPKPRSS
jgi:hypothetical protein